MNTYSEFVHNYSKQETTQMSFSWWVGKKPVVCLYNGILHSGKMEQTIGIHNNLGESQIRYARWKKSD